MFYVKVKKNLQNVKISTLNGNMLVIRYEDVSKYQMVIDLNEITAIGISDQMQYENQDNLIVDKKTITNYSEIEIFFGEHQATIYFDLDTIPTNEEPQPNIFNIYVVIRSLWTEYKKNFEKDLFGIPQG